MACYKAAVIFGLLLCVSVCAGLNVKITVNYNPPADFTLLSPPYFRPATSVTLTCCVEGASGAVSYQWSSTGPNSFVVNSNLSTVSKTILTSDDAGNHSCNANDSAGNTDSSTIEMQMIGGGIFVNSSEKLISKSVANNSVVFLKTTPCPYCKLSFYCYSNSSETDVGLIIFPSGGQIYRHPKVYGAEVFRMNPSGIRFRNYASLAPSYEGVYTCRLPDSNGNILDINIAYYRTYPKIPNIYYSRFTLQNQKGEEAFGMIEIRTRYSPPTEVTWQRDGVIVHAPPRMEGAGYEMTQILLNSYRYKRYSYYTTYLRIKNIAHLAGSHVYTCDVENYGGSTSKNISTHLQVGFDMDISPPTNATHLEPFTLKCKAFIVQSNFAPGLMQYAKLEWVGPDGEVMTSNGNINITEEKEVVVDGQGLRNNLTSTLTFNPMIFRREGEYTCRGKFDFPGGEAVTYNQISTKIDVIDRTVIQLKFGPLPHCSQWYKDKNITTHLERDVRRVIMDVLNKSCDYTCQKYPNISNVEFSCQAYVSCVTFRATLTGSNHTLTVPQMMIALTEWLTTDGTFVYNYNIPIRLRADPGCPIKINDFFDEECMGKECHDISCSKE